MMPNAVALMMPASSERRTDQKRQKWRRSAVSFTFLISAP